MENALTIERLFSGRLLRIPDYQRGYAWERKQWNDFMEDLDLLGVGKHHFTGTVVLDRITKPATGQSPQADAWDLDGTSYEQFHVVDGQQRLTTVVLLLDAVRRELERHGHRHLADGVRKGYIETTDVAGQRLMKLKLNSDTNAFWEDTILAERPGPQAPSNASQQRLLDARRYFGQYLESRSTGDGYDEWLTSLRSKVIGNLVLVPYEVSSSAEVGVIFEVMNDRGKPLTELEKAKNYLLYVSTKLDLPSIALEQRVNLSWTQIFQRLMAAGLSDPSNEDQLMRSHWLMAIDPDKRSWRGVGSLKRDVLSLRSFKGRHKELLRAADHYAFTLDRAALAYAELMNPQLPAAFEALATTEAERLAIVDAARRFARVRATATFLPLLIATRLAHPTDGRHYMAVLDLCERFAFRVYRLLGKYANSGQSRFYRLANEVFLGAKTPALVLEEIRSLVTYYSPAAEYDASLSDGRTRAWYPWFGLKYFLYEWEVQLAGKRGPQLTWERIEQRDASRSIEHVLPQTPEDPSYWTRRFSVAARVRLTHDLGNLVLTEDNQSYGRKPFPNKRGSPGQLDEAGNLLPCYANSVLYQERDLVPNKDWTPKEIEERRRRILAWARRRWHVDAPLADAVITAEDDEQDEIGDADDPLASAALPLYA